MIDNKNKDTKKITTLIILIVTLMVCETGATYAYFAFSVSSNNTLTGTAATASLEFTAPPSLTLPSNSNYTSKPMVPQKSLVGTTNVLQKAVTGVKPTGESAVIPCVDGNGNVICRVYTFTIKNTSTATAVLKGQIKFDWGANNTAANWYENLKWKLMTNAGTVNVSSSDTAKSATKAWQNFATSLSLAPNASKQYWVVVWIEEIGSSQNNTDKGTWTASIQFINNVDNSGITSTITS